MSILTDPDVPCDSLRQRLYAGDLAVLTRLGAAAAFARYAADELRKLFSPHDPEHAHEHIAPAEMARILGAWKPRFIHAERSRQLVRAIIAEAGFPAAETHYNVPKPRTSFPAGHLTSGIATGFGWHRDTWYGAPAQQLNWWLPVFPVREDNAMAFDLASFGQDVPNDSETFDYYRHNAARSGMAAQVDRHLAARPEAAGHEPAQQTVVLPAPGQVLLFSGAQLHATIPNTSGLARYSADFRTVSVPDLRAGRGAPMTDARCTGTAIRDFISVADEHGFSEQLVTRLFGPPPPGAVLVFSPPGA
jgi:hypothetical protein